ncbi:glycosyl transferase [bacterium (Candidatus Gribaldobacteria) CG_4_10_14_0_2_um_filter_41_16]|uniref:Glycosyl transferase n=1 Tax=bacterium (Candidatus Gribaldobacteria) CG_4_10_14_0_2_um_filter_41_16 TaxID=2014265 RepID=A0A2M7VI04_9BACT|nr:MAG: hypothetical protein AUJ11_02445 [Parcubacteria group bacterium CG1_02_44_65]PJA01477.1 MAG: glycosyl transferase [bacterium (Candidatus Gribaldobacteria) CG_4_10_14_0_2_um_filter_41_16]
MYYFCTLFDKNYLFRGLALYDSLIRHCPDFKFWILCLDNEAYEMLEKLNLDKVVLISMAEFEDEELLAVKKTRSQLEYYWTLSPALPSYVLNKNPQIPSIAYLDSDLFFFADPKPLYDELGDGSVLIMEHKLPEGKKHKEKDVGKYNVGMMLFNNNAEGRKCLEWWRQKCNEWCYYKVEPTRFADQKYLDYFAEKFKGVVVSKHEGANLSYWNMKNFRDRLKKIGGQIYIKGDQLIFFHFSSIKFYDPLSKFLPRGPLDPYTLPSREKRLIYSIYFKATLYSIKKILAVDQDFRHGFIIRPNIFKQLKDVFWPMAEQSIKKNSGPLRPLLAKIKKIMKKKS